VDRLQLLAWQLYHAVSVVVQNRETSRLLRIPPPLQTIGVGCVRTGLGGLLCLLITRHVTRRSFVEDVRQDIRPQICCGNFA